MSTKPVYAAETLLHDRKIYEVGDRIDEALPEELVSKLLDRGEATMSKPKTTSAE